MYRKPPPTTARLIAAKIMCIVVTYRPLQESRPPGDGAELASPTRGAVGRDAEIRTNCDGTPIHEVALCAFGHSPGAFACSRSIRSKALVASTT